MRLWDAEIGSARWGSGGRPSAAPFFLFESGGQWEPQ